MLGTVGVALFAQLSIQEITLSIPRHISRQVVEPVLTGTTRAVNAVYEKVEAKKITRAKLQVSFAATMDTALLLTENIVNDSCTKNGVPPENLTPHLNDETVVQSKLAQLSSIRNPSNIPPIRDQKLRRTFKVLLIGVDTRLGKTSARADALHLLCVDLDSGRVEIVSIPRGTHVAIGYQNHVANIISHIRSARGRTDLMRRVAEITRRGNIAYYVEVGFSQAIGILELIGYHDPASELEELRRRKGYQFGDRERCYTQARFLKNSLLKYFDLFTGASGDVLLSAGLALVETNLTKEICQGIIYSLKEKSFPHDQGDVTIRLESHFEKRIVARHQEQDSMPTPHTKKSNRLHSTESLASKKIRTALHFSGEKDFAPKKVITTLETIFQQHGWLQIRDPHERILLRDSIANLLSAAYTSLGNQVKLFDIRQTLKSEDSLFMHMNQLRTSALRSQTLPTGD